MKRLAILALLLALPGCQGMKHVIIRPAQAPPLKTRTEPERPTFSGPHEVILLTPGCEDKVKIVRGWCEVTDKPNVFRCYQIELEAPGGCVIVQAAPEKR